MKVYTELDDLQEFKPWSGAEYAWQKIVEAGKGEEFISMLEYDKPEGMTETEINDLLWFEPEYCFGLVGLEEEEEEEEITPQE